MFEFAIAADSGAARAGTLTLPHGTVRTPAFLPVGTQGTVRALSPFDLRAVGTQMLLANTYHLHVRPGEDVVATLGGLNRFMGWDGPILTDSGGFQIFSLPGDRTVSEEGARFRSYVDQRPHLLSPERSIEVQTAIGADVMMALDVCLPSTEEPAAVRAAMDRAHPSAVRSLPARTDNAGLSARISVLLFYGHHSFSSMGSQAKYTALSN